MIHLNILQAATLVSRIQTTNWSQSIKNYAAARVYAAAGLHILPIGAGKAPVCAGGVHSATRNAMQLRKWFLVEKAPKIGVACGSVEGLDGQLVVIDLDAAKGGRSGGFDWLKSLPKELIETLAGLTAKTAGGGVHRWTMAPACASVRNTVSAIATGVDTRAAGGYVVVPPSDGYEFIRPVAAPPETPAWFLDALTQAQGGSAAKAAPQAANVVEFPTFQASARDESRIADMAAAQEGARHDTLLRGAAAMAAAGADATAMDRMGAAARKAGLPADEVARTVQDATEWGRARRGERLSTKTEGLRLPTTSQVAPIFPIDALPSPIREYVEVTATSLAVSSAAVAASVLSACASALARRAVVTPWGGYSFAPSVLWSGVIGPPGSRKSGIM